VKGKVDHKWQKNPFCSAHLPKTNFISRNILLSSSKSRKEILDPVSNNSSFKRSPVDLNNQPAAPINLELDKNHTLIKRKETMRKMHENCLKVETEQDARDMSKQLIAIIVWHLNTI
jgi:hypothetical protein